MPQKLIGERRDFFAQFQHVFFHETFFLGRRRCSVNRLSLGFHDSCFGHTLSIRHQSEEETLIWFLIPQLWGNPIKKLSLQFFDCVLLQLTNETIIHIGTYLQLFANWRAPAHCKLSRLLWQQIFYFVNKRVKVSKFSTENQQRALVVCLLAKI